MSRVLTYKAEEADAGRCVRDIIREEFCLAAHDIARAKYRTRNGIAVNGEVSMVNRTLVRGDTVTVVLGDEQPEKTVPSPGPIEILYEDEDVICLNKPAGVVVHPSHGHFADTLGNRLAAYFAGKGEAHEIRTIGRLDKDTTGVISFGKSRTACAILAGQIRRPRLGGEDGSLKKQYLALAAGSFETPEGEIDLPISREYEEKIRRVVRPDGDPALTRYRVLRQYERYAVLSLEIETGRTHQIRVHMAHTGHPLLGDPIYGPGEACRILPEPPLETGGGDDLPARRSFGADPSAAVPAMPERAALHAWKAGFIQPFSYRRIFVTAPVPEDMRQYL